VHSAVRALWLLLSEPFQETSLAAEFTAAWAHSWVLEGIEADNTAEDIF
jgi:hypothetical protein